MSLEDKFYPFLSLYERLPRSLNRAVGVTYRLVPERFRRGEHYREFKDLAEEGEHWERHKIATYQFEELKKTLLHAARHCPFYRERFSAAGFDAEKFSSFEDLKKAPLVTKKDLLEHRDRIVSEAFNESQRLYITTGGSTGIPVGFYLQKGISRPKEAAFLEAMWKRGGYFDGARLALLRGHVTTPRSNGAISSYDGTRDWLILSSAHLSAERLPEYIRELEKFKPDLIHAYPSSALILAEQLQMTGQTWDVPLRGILCGSERITEPQRKLLETVFGCRVYSWYGHSERVVLAGGGRKTNLYYFVPQYGFAEFGPPDQDGLREVIGTSFHNLVMPLIRYRTGDYVRLAENESEFEFPVPAASEIAGREQEFLLTSTGRRISLTSFNMHDSIFDDIYAVQFFQGRPGVAEFRYVPGPHFDRARLRQIEERITQKLGDDLKVTLKAVKEVEKTAAGKHKWLVSTAVESHARL